MLKERLNHCATLLFHWISFHKQSKSFTELNFEDFRAWTGEFLEQSVTPQEINQALLQLTKLQLIQLEAEGIKTLPHPEEKQIKIEPLPKDFWKIWTWESRAILWSMAISGSILLLTMGAIVLNYQTKTNSLENTAYFALQIKLNQIENK